MKFIENNIGVLKVNCFFYMVLIQLKNLILVGIVIRYVMKEKKGSRMVLVVNMWCVYIVIDNVVIDSVV